MQKSIENEKFDPCKTITPENFTLKLCTRDYIGEIAQQATFDFNWYSGFLETGKIWPLCDFFYTVLSLPFSPSCTQVELLAVFSHSVAHMACFCIRTVLLGLRQWVTSFGGNTPQPPPSCAKVGMNRQVQVKMLKNKNHSINWSSWNLRTKPRPMITFRRWSTQIKSNIAASHHLENRNDVITLLQMVWFGWKLARHC